MEKGKANDPSHVNLVDQNVSVSCSSTMLLRFAFPSLFDNQVKDKLLFFRMFVYIKQTIKRTNVLWPAEVTSTTDDGNLEVFFKSDNVM